MESFQIWKLSAMESSVVETPTLHFPAFAYDSLPLSSPSSSPTFLFHHRFISPHQQNSGIEMITFQSVTYTSLRDLISSPSPATMTSAPTQSSSLNEIPIKNPLVKQAALAYLLPMATPTEMGDKGFLAKMRENGLGCLDWFSDAVLKTAKDAFGGIADERRGEIEMGKEEQDEDEEEDEDGDGVEEEKKV